MQKQNNGLFTDVLYRKLASGHIIDFRSGLTCYRERFLNGCLVSGEWNGTGFLDYDNELENVDFSHPSCHVFRLVIGGQELSSHWEWEGFERNEENNGLHLIVSMRHQYRPVQVKIHTLLDGTAIITRYLEITNLGNSPSPLSGISVWSGILDYWATTSETIYEVGYFSGTAWGNEGLFQWQNLQSEHIHIDGRYNADRHRHPMFVVRNRQSGSYYFGNFAWTGSYSFEFIQNQPGLLTFNTNMEGQAPLRVIGAGESAITPAMHLGMSQAGFDKMIQEMHDHLRKSVLLNSRSENSRLVGTCIDPCYTYVDCPRNMKEVDICAELGAEIFWIDASWYAPPSGSWFSTVGDWEINRDRYPDGFEKIRDYVHSKGMLFGVWMEPERVSETSHLFEEHPEWMVKRYDNNGVKRQYVLDISRKEVAEWMEERIADLIEESKLDFFRIDHNVSGFQSGGYDLIDGYQENFQWRYYENLYSIFERLTKRFPEVIFQNCASGGGRTDIGMTRFFNNTWVTDWTKAPRAMSIYNGMSMVLPPEFIARYIARGQKCHRCGDLDSQIRLAIIAHPEFGNIMDYQSDTNPGTDTPSPKDYNPAPLNPQTINRLKHGITLYKEFIRPFQSDSRIYHHTPVIEGGNNPCGYCVIEMVSQSKDRAVAAIFRLSDPADDSYHLRFKGLDPGLTYEVTFDNPNSAVRIPGFQLINDGLTISLQTPLSSELLLIRSINT